MDLDRFKELNDTLRHRHGDPLLQEIGSRLTSTLRAADSVARMGGDEFAILLPAFTDPTAVGQAVGRIREVLAQPFEVDGMWLDGSASIGVALYPHHGENVDLLLQRADVAMYVAKETRVPFAVYSPDHDRQTAAALAMSGDLRQALNTNDLVLHYQPKVDLSNGAVTGVEALVRWQHPTRGLVLPDEFIPIAEHTGLIKPLTAWVLGAALRQCRSWQDAGVRMPVAVNLSPRAMFDPHLPDQVAELLRNNGLPAQMLALEITEGAVMANRSQALDLLERFDAMGVQLSIDDFGVGYSSLTYLKILPVRELKIDKSFVVHMAHDRNDRQIVRSTIDLGHNLGLRVVAEGVETAEVGNRLAALDCDVAQGYWFSPPLPEPQLRHWLDERVARLIA
jgi:diguanylate cyclase (GGDEF)-like protein